MKKSSELLLNGTIACIYFGATDYTEALNYLNKIINNTIVDVRNDVSCFARILNLIVHFELGNYELLEYVVISTYRFLYKKNRLYKLETSVIDFTRKKNPKIKSDKELIIAFREFKSTIEEIFKDPFEQKALEFFDFISWLESKIANKPFAEIIKEKSKFASGNTF